MPLAQFTKQPFGSQFFKATKGTPTPTGSGWNEDHFVIDWMSDHPAPTAVLEQLSCSCTRSCQLPVCSRPAIGLKCRDVCKLVDCDNRREDFVQEDVSDEIDENDVK